MSNAVISASDIGVVYQSFMIRCFSSSFLCRFSMSQCCIGKRPDDCTLTHSHMYRDQRDAGSRTLSYHNQKELFFFCPKEWKYLYKYSVCSTVFMQFCHMLLYQSSAGTQGCVLLLFYPTFYFKRHKISVPVEQICSTAFGWHVFDLPIHDFILNYER